MLISAEHIEKNYGARQLLDDVTVYLDGRQRLGVIGINGAGKSTLLRILAGEETPDRGAVTCQRNLRIAYLPQDPPADGSKTVLEQVFSGFSPSFREINEYEVRAMLGKLGIDDPSAFMGALSGGQRKRVALASALIHPAEVLILDEPTNHLDADMVVWLEERLRRFTGGIVMVTHDRYFLERVVTEIVELDRGRAYSYQANFSRYLELRAQRHDMEAASERKRQAILRREYQWIMRGARARSTKAKGRIDRYNELLDREAPEEGQTVKMITASSRLGKKLIELDNVSKSFDGKKVIDGFSYTVKRRDRIGVTGRNGAGKSTLLNLISGALPPDEGRVEAGSTVRVGYFTQEGWELDGTMRAWDLVAQAASEVRTEEGAFSVSALMERFLFGPEMQYAPIGSLSGGERRRLYLLSILMSAPNILLLDEPTNDLDVETLMILEDYLESFPGAVIAVSHDRYFLDKMAEEIFEVGEGGRVSRFTGSFADYLDKRPAPESERRREDAPKARRETADRPQKPKMTFREQREFETIDGDLAALEERIRRKEAESRANATDYVRLLELDGELELLRRELEEKAERWLYLSELAQAVESAGKQGG